MGPAAAELGGVSPIIVVPGRWSAADLRFQAEHIATMRLHNAGHNCIAGQVVILSADWPQRNAFLKELRRALAAAPARLTVTFGFGPELVRRVAPDRAPAWLRPLPAFEQIDALEDCDDVQNVYANYDV